jgi:four helix bundle protein
MAVHSTAAEKSYKFALRIVKLSLWLRKKRSETVLSRQILRSGTSIGANLEEALGSQSDKDFYTKVTIAYKEARETHYWLRLLRDSQLLPEKAAVNIINDRNEILKIIGSIKNTTSRKINNRPDS